MMCAFASSFLARNLQYIVSVTVVIKENDEATLKAFRSIVGDGATNQSKDMLTHQLPKTDGEGFITPPQSPSQIQNTPGLEDDPCVPAVGSAV